MAQFVGLSLGWQTLLGAGFAVIAALMGARVVLHQVAETRRLEDGRRIRRAAALRAVLTLGLMEIYDYVGQCALTFADLLLTQPDEEIDTAGINIPPLPAGLISQFTDLIEIGEPNHARQMIVFIRRLQIHHANAADSQMLAASPRLSLLVRQNVIQNLVIAAEVHARCDHLLVYARSDDDRPPAITTANDVRKSARILLIARFDVPELEERIHLHENYASDKGVPWPDV